MSPNACVVLHERDLSVVLDLTDGRLPAVVHWGARVADLSAADAAVLVRAGIVPAAPNSVDDPMRLAVLPEHWSGWVGRPGVSGSRSGVAWSPKFTTTALRVDGAEVPAEQTVVNRAGPATVMSMPSTKWPGSSSAIELEMLPGGLLRARATLTNRGEPYGLDDLVLAFPVPSHAAEVLDLAGRWGKERTPQRRAMPVGTHLREGRRGRTGADAATVLHLGDPGFDFSGGEIWAVHTG